MVKYMKNKYEVFSINTIFIIVILIIEILFILSMFNINIKKYKVFDGVVLKDNLIEIVVNSKDLTLFDNNKFIYYDNKKIKFEKIEVIRDITEGYHLLKIECDTKKKHVNDVYRFTIFSKKINILRMFEVIWKEEEL